MTKSQILPRNETASIRQKLQGQDDIKFVDRFEFSKLLVSFRRLERSDVGKARIHGLRDPLSGIRYLIEEEKLYPSSTTA